MNPMGPRTDCRALSDRGHLLNRGHGSPAYRERPGSAKRTQWISGGVVRAVPGVDDPYDSRTILSRAACSGVMASGYVERTDRRTVARPGTFQVPYKIERSTG